MPNNQIKTNQAEVTATAAQQVASDFPGKPHPIRMAGVDVGFGVLATGHSENGFKLLPDCLSSWPHTCGAFASLLFIAATFSL